MDRKILIYKYIEDLKPVGGSNGYCFNILKELEKRDNKDISFLTNKQESKFKPNSFKKYFQTLLSFGKKNNVDVSFEKYDAIHFHSSKDLYLNRKILKKYKGKIVFTTHSPIPSHMEMVENIKKHHQFLGLFLPKHAFSKIDKYCFNRADIILLPCKEAEESYYLHWEKYKKIHANNECKFKYILTGINEAKSTIDSDQYRSNLGYTDNDFIVSYVGRHNAVKGYDRIVKICDLLNDTNIKFLVGGQEFPIKAPNKPQWKEIGWTNDPYSLINCSDLFILPNRETYFDIVLLEVLSLGKSCLISNTGGNKVILSKKCDGIYGFNNEEEAAGIIKKLYMQKNKTRYMESVKRLFYENFTIQLFVDKYVELLNNIFED